MLTIQTIEGSLINWANYDSIDIVPIGPDPDQGHSLIASKNNGENRNETVLCFGSEQDCQDDLDLVVKALMNHHSFVSLIPESPRLSEKPRQGPLVPDFGGSPLIDLDDDFGF